MLLGLIRPSAGTVRVLGAEPGNPHALRRIGSLVEAPAFYPYLSGRDNLRVMARWAGVGDRRVEEALTQVALSPRARDAFQTYSLGMKQRLGVAAALVKNPDLLILDEPTNGLDPPGMVDMRALIRTLRAEGRTLLLSSHQLNDVEQLCDRVGVIRGGRLVAQGTVDALRGARGVLVRATPLDGARRHLEALVGAEQVRLEEGALRVDVDPVRASALAGALAAAGIMVAELRPIQRSLEEVFFALTEGRSAGAESLRGMEV
jgi:ABC-2 type transport system ATP-binding protein